MKKSRNTLEFDESVNKYFKEIKDFKPLSYEEQYELWLKYKNENDIEARDKLISSNLKFVANIAKKYQGRGLSYSDLIAEGNVGLLKALDEFDGEKGFKMISYAVWWIKQSILEALDKRNTLDTENLPEIKEIKTKDDEPIVEYEEDHEILEEDIDIFEKDDNKTKIGFLMNYLSPKERNIITEYFGLDGNKPKTLEEIGNELGITKERIRQINENSFKKMRTQAMIANLKK